MAKWEYLCNDVVGAAVELQGLVESRAARGWEPYLLTTVGNDKLVVLFRRPGHD